MRRILCLWAKVIVTHLARTFCRSRKNHAMHAVHVKTLEYTSLFNTRRFEPARFNKVKCFLPTSSEANFCLKDIFWWVAPIGLKMRAPQNHPKLAITRKTNGLGYPYFRKPPTMSWNNSILLIKDIWGFYVFSLWGTEPKSFVKHRSRSLFMSSLNWFPVHFNSLPQFTSNNVRHSNSEGKILYYMVEYWEGMRTRHLAP